MNPEPLIRTESPVIYPENLVTTEDGYQVRQLCIVDGRPARVDLDINTHRPAYSGCDIAVWGIDAYPGWSTVYNLRASEIGHPPNILLDEGVSAAAWLTQIADLLWRTANVVLIQARQREEQLERVLELQKVQDAAVVRPLPATAVPAVVTDESLTRVMAALRYPDEKVIAEDKDLYTMVAPLMDFLETEIGKDNEARAAKATDPRNADLEAAADYGMPSDAQLAELRDKLAGDA